MPGNETGSEPSIGRLGTNMSAGKHLSGSPATKLFTRKSPGSPGKLGKTSSLAESLSKLRGKGAIK
jgi:hypothetical protein